jgi:hypothetical protein
MIQESKGQKAVAFAQKGFLTGLPDVCGLKSVKKEKI